MEADRDSPRRVDGKRKNYWYENSQVLKFPFTSFFNVAPGQFLPEAVNLGDGSQRLLMCREIFPRWMLA